MNDDVSEVIQTLTTKKDNLSSRLESLVDEYWVTWRDINRNIISQSANPDSVARVGVIAPSIRIYENKSHDRIILRWRIYENSWARLNVAKENKQTLRYGKEISRNKDGTTSRTKLAKVSVSWEMELVDKFLTAADPIITLMNCIHQSLKQFSRLKIKQTEE